MGNLDFSANASQLEELAAYMASQINVPTIGIGGGYAPIGTIISVMGTTAPQDYLACDGTVYDIADYPQLADYFESQFGESNHFGGNGTTTFAVPDLQGEFLRGTGTNSHENQGSGANVGVHQDGTYFPMSATISGNRLYYYRYNSSDNIGAGNFDSGYNNVSSDKGLLLTGTTDSGSSAYTANTVRPTNTSVLYCIKAVVAGEVYSTDERVVGTWIDGKPLYQKVIDIGAFPNNTSKNVAHNISNLKRVISLKGNGYEPDYHYTLPFVSPIGNQHNIEIGVTSTNVTIITGRDRSSVTGTVIIEYTKTTD